MIVKSKISSIGLRLTVIMRLNKWNGREKKRTSAHLEECSDIQTTLRLRLTVIVRQNK